MSKTQKFGIEIIFNVFLICLAVYILIGSVQLGFGTLKEPGAGFFPFVGGLVILVSDILTFLPKTRAYLPIFKEKGGVMTFLSFLLIFSLWIIVMPYLGYVIVTFIAAFVMFKVMHLEGWIKPVLFSIGIASFIYLLFDCWLYLDLPRGFLG